MKRLDPVNAPSPVPRSPPARREKRRKQSEPPEGGRKRGRQDEQPAPDEPDPNHTIDEYV